ncbi:MAG TPA: Gfo/Idh/MocA family oxidoreductase [Actinocrinis sp.]|nr:Gfo/Idh/MocA family oxidoreductase [Actinocrinis sp.]
MRGTTPLRLLLVGAGSMGSLHARVIAQSGDCVLAGVVDPDEPAGRALAERHGAPWTADLAGLDGLAGPAGVDAVIVAAPTEHHHRLALDVLSAGKPLLLEKPVCDSLAATREVLAASAARGVPLMCGLLERYNPAILTGFALIRQPVHVSAVRHGPYAPRIRTGVAWDLLVHDVDLVVRAFGGALPVQTRGSTGRFHPDSAAGAEDVAEAVLTFPDGALGTVSASRLGQRKVRSLEIAELDRLIEIDLLRRDVTVYRHVSHEAACADGRGYRQQTVIEIPELVTAAEPLATQLARFADLVRGRADPDAERDSILPAHRLVDQVLAQSRAGVPHQAGPASEAEIEAAAEAAAMAMATAATTQRG